MFEGKIALVTGGASGIGSVIVEKFAEYGADVIIADLKVDDETEVVKKIRGMGRKVYPMVLDISNVDAIREGVQKIVKETGKIDILVNNAGVYPACPVMDADEKHFDFVMGIDLKGLFFMTQTVVKESMLPNQYGRIVNIASIDGKNPAEGVGVYSAAKAGVISFTKSFALELAGTGINCNCVAPGWVESKTVLASDRWKTYLPRIPARRLGKLSEIAEAVCFQCNDKVSYIDGEILDVNGGIIMD